MQLIIQNLGAIKQGEIDLTKKFYVLVGYNNTGKTYVSQLLWSIFNEETLENFSKQVQLKELHKELHFELETKGGFEITPEIINQILEAFTSFLKQQMIPQIFNIELNHFILENFSLRFEYNLDTLKSSQTISAFILGAKVFTLSKEKDLFWVKVTQENIPKKKWVLASATQNEADRNIVIPTNSPLIY